MKEILFRGKTKSGKLVYGSLILAGDYYCCILEDESKVHPMDWPYLDDLETFDGKATPVIPETVSRLIAHTCYDSDHTDRDFFECDIIAVYKRHSDVEHDEPYKYAIIIYESTITENGSGLWFPQDTTCIKVVGNVWDNPELIGEKYAELYKYYNGFKMEVKNES